MKQRRSLLMTLLLALTILLAACAGPQPASPLPQTGSETEVVNPSPVPATEEPVVKEATPTAAPAGPAEPLDEQDGEPGGSVTVMGAWGEAEGANFLAMLAPFEEQTGIEVLYENPRDLTKALSKGLEDGSPPDIAALPNPGALRLFAAQGALVPLEGVLDTARLQQEYPQGFTDLARVGSQTYGVFIKASLKNLVWFRPIIFRELGYEVPQTWEELLSLEQQIISSGGVPWCAGVVTGWPGTDWVEDLLLQTAGPAAYDAWLNGQLSWTDPAVAGAWEAWGRIVGDPALVYGGPASVLTSKTIEIASKMFDEEPGCFMNHQASFLPVFLQERFPDLKPGEDLDFFPLPPMDAQQGSTLLVGGDLFAMFNDTPQARLLMAYLTTAEAQAIWAQKGGFIATNRAVPPEVYPDEISRSLAQLYIEAESVHFDASDQMPPALQEAFHEAVLQYIHEPASLQSILKNLESLAQETGAQ